MATTALFGNMLNQKTTSNKVKKEEATSPKPKNIEELRQMAKAKLATKKVAKKIASKKAKKK